MRCLTLGEELLARGHEARLLGAVEIGWLAEQVAATGIEHVDAAADELDVRELAEGGYDAIVVDSYRIPAGAINALNSRVPVLAVIDGDHRGIRASAYLDQNLGAETVHRDPEVARRLMAGSTYSLVRQDIRRLRRIDGWRMPETPRVLAFMGGSDPAGAMPRIAAGLRVLPHGVPVTVVAAPAWRDQVASALASRPDARVVAPTPHLPALLAESDVVVSAAGTSAWDIGTMAIPAVFSAVVENQQDGLAAIVEAGIGLGVDAVGRLDALDAIGGLVAGLLADEDARRALVASCLARFDGRGAARVADALQQFG